MISLLSGLLVVDGIPDVYLLLGAVVVVIPGDMKALVSELLWSRLAVLMVNLLSHDLEVFLVKFVLIMNIRVSPQ